MVGITSALNQNTATSAGAVDTNKAATKIAADLDSFLLMLTTQLQNQDPLSPMESSEFTNQLVGFAQVEQQIGMNSNLQALQGMQAQTQNSLALSYLGRYAEIADNQVALKDGKARFAYVLDSDANSVTVTIKDSKGDVVKTMPGENNTGNHLVDWDGKDSTGVLLPDGNYTIKVTSSTGTEQTEKDLPTVVQAQISAVSTGGDEPTLTINGLAVPMSEVRTISMDMST